MTKDEFLTTLRTLIQDMPPEDRRDVMNYYTEYFEDAGPEREQEVLRQLGSPEQVAREVLGGGFAPAQEPAGAPKRNRGLISAIAMICAAPIALPLMAAGVLVVCCMALAALLCVGGLLVAAVAVVVMGGASMGAALFTGGLGSGTVLYFLGSGLALLAFGVLFVALFVRFGIFCFRKITDWASDFVNRRRVRQ
ncbi:DUF1700 domain-containing protein [Ruminococcaceae bacterium AM07-15]|nr:DUF1700 domain-containing protein [Ruminococcaceae bacterium AM07-15]